MHMYFELFLYIQNLIDFGNLEACIEVFGLFFGKCKKSDTPLLPSVSFWPHILISLILHQPFSSPTILSLPIFFLLQPQMEAPAVESSTEGDTRQLGSADRRELRTGGAAHLLRRASCANKKGPPLPRGPWWGGHGGEVLTASRGRAHHISGGARWRPGAKLPANRVEHIGD
jgi:hypothetical protein